MKKRLLSFMMAGILIFINVDISVFAGEIIASGECVRETECEEDSNVILLDEVSVEKIVPAQYNFVEAESDLTESKVDEMEELSEVYQSDFFDEENYVQDNRLLSSKSNACGDSLTWTLENGTLVISGAGDMMSWGKLNDVPWYEYTMEIKEIIIDDKVTSIGNYAFS